MTAAVFTFAKKVARYVAMVVAALGAVSGSVAAIQWGIAAFGPVPVALVGAFVLGCVLTAALIHARGSPSRTP